MSTSTCYVTVSQYVIAIVTVSQYVIDTVTVSQYIIGEILKKTEY